MLEKIGDKWVHQTALTANDAQDYDRFGSSVAINGNTIVVGALLGDGLVADSGSAYVFTGSGSNWTQQQELSAIDGAGSDYFGSSVGIDGDTIVVGAERETSDKGAAYVFARSEGNWTQEQKLFASDGTTDDYFGRRVAIDGNSIIVGSYLDDDGGTNTGSAYIYNWDGASWLEQDKLTASDRATTDYFGWSVDINNNRAIVGARYDDHGATNTGSGHYVELHIMASIRTSQGECGRRRKKRQRHRAKVKLAPQHLLAAARLGQCLSRESTKLTPWSVLVVAAK